MAIKTTNDLAGRILEILDLVEENRGTFEAEAGKRGITVNQLLAAAIAPMAAERSRARHGRSK